MQLELQKAFMRPTSNIGESIAMRIGLLFFTLVVIGLFLVLPLVSVFWHALANGIWYYAAALMTKETRSAILLTFAVTAVSVPFSTVFGCLAAWCVSKFTFPFRRTLITIIELPFSVSPVIVGMMFLLLFGLRGWFGSWLETHGLKVAFAIPGLILVTVFVTLPFVARQLIPLMEELGTEEEEAALVLGANGWQIFKRITLPNIRWALFYGVLLCNARAMGEFGAVAVISGRVRGMTETMPLAIEGLYNDYDIQAAFAVASLLATLGIITLALKTILEWRQNYGSKTSNQVNYDVYEKVG